MKINLLALLLLTSLLVGCATIEESISQDEAKELVLAQHQKHIGTPEILSIEVKRNAYIIQWENKGNKEWGTDKVTKSGEVKMIETTIE